MFDFDVGKLLLIGVVALIFIPPKDLPEALRTLGRMISQARRMAADFQGQFSEAMREAELSDLKDQLVDLKNKASVEETFNRVASMLEQPSKASSEAIAEAETALAAARAQVAAEEADPIPARPNHGPSLAHEPESAQKADIDDAAQDRVQNKAQVDKAQEDNAQVQAPGAPGSAA